MLTKEEYDAQMQLNLKQDAVCSVVRNRIAENFLKFFNPIVMEHWRNGVLLNTYKTINDITNEGKNLLFDVMFNGNGSGGGAQAQIATTSWFIGLISLASYTALAATDTMASHSGWTEFTTYTPANRIVWGSGTSSGQSVTNASALTYTVTAPGGTVKGVFVTSSTTIGGTTGKLWATALFAADVPVSAGDALRVTYTVSA